MSARDEESSRPGGDAHAVSDVGQRDAAYVQNRSHTGQALSPEEQNRISAEVARMVLEGRDEAAIAGQFPGVDRNLIRQYVQQAETARDWNPMDNTPGPRQASTSPDDRSGSLLGGLASGLSRVAAGVAGAASSVASTVREATASAGERLFSRGVTTDGADISYAELGNLSPNLQVGKGRGVDGPSLSA